MITQELPWIAPLEAASMLTQGERFWALYYSGQQRGYTGRYSFLALYPQDIISGHDASLLAGKLSQDKPTLENAWFGYLGYEMGAPTAGESYITLPDVWCARFGLILQFDHESHILLCSREAHIALPMMEPVSLPAAPAPDIKNLATPMTQNDYLAIVAKTREAIIQGDFYQANITRKYTGEFAKAQHCLPLFGRLCEASPAAYSACIRMGEAAILSSSPEQFLAMDAQGHMESRPIKGTAARLAGSAEDEAARRQLENSPKDRAENLMIVDLMRNDFSQSCEPGSVKAERLFEVSSYATLHHMASAISGRKRREVSTLDAVLACFPPGSMTGAPKIRAIEWCRAQEQMRRGVYSGALGWFGGDGSCDLSVVIRTIVMQGNRFEFQVGGGIVADSDSQAEWQETLTKARGIMLALGLDMAMLEGL